VDDNVQLTCPGCGATLRIPASAAGRQGKCPTCQAVFTVPEVSAPAAAPVAAAPAPPAAPAAAPSAAVPGAIRANRLLAGKRCPACGGEVLLGQEVVQCPKCGEPSHAACWQQRGGCASATCAPVRVAPAQQAPGAVPMAGPTKACPACAEQIPAAASVCPYCSEVLDGSGPAMPPGIPNEFIGRRGAFGAQKWAFTVQGQELVGIDPKGGPKIRVPRAEADQRVILKRHKVKIYSDTGNKGFVLDDLGYLAVRYWLTRQTTPITCSHATNALVSALVGIFFCNIVLGPAAIVHAVRARKMIAQHPQILTGSGMALAGMIVGIIDPILFILVIAAQAAAH